MVDEDINPEDPNEVLLGLDHAVSAGDGHVSSSRAASPVLSNLSATVDGLTSKAMLDLTIKENFRGEVAEPTDAMRQMVLQRRWKEYGFKIIVYRSKAFKMD